MLEEMLLSVELHHLFLYTQKKPKEISFVIRPTLHNLKCHFNAESKRIKKNNQTKSTQTPQEPKESGEQFKLNQFFIEMKQG